MSVLSCCISGVVVIGDDIDIIVLGVEGNQVRFGIRDPRGVSVHRKEIYDRIRLENAQGIHKPLPVREKDDILVLTCCIAERVIIDDDIYFTVLGVNGEDIKLNLVLPKGRTR